MVPPAPPELGRAVIVGAGAAAPPQWKGLDRVVVDEKALVEPALVVPLLHRAWGARTPIVIELAVDGARFRDPGASTEALWRLGAAAELWLDRLHFLVWANSDDARAPGAPIWWWARKASRWG
ncbi:MAG: hypothetical protein ACT4OV_16235, partial [Microthrixaceae bacterium]